MVHAIDLTDATDLLVAQFGRRFNGSRSGGQQRLIACLRDRYDLSEAEALRLVKALEQQRNIEWVPQHGVPQGCPGLLDLCGDWILRSQNRFS